MTDKELMELDGQIRDYEDAVRLFPDKDILSRNTIEKLHALIGECLGDRVPHKHDWPTHDCKCGAKVTIPLKPGTVYCRQCGRKITFV